MKNDGTNTASTHSMDSNRGTAVKRFPSRIARATEACLRSWTWMFSISTVVSSTRIPTAKARPPSVIRLIVCPPIHRPTTAAIIAKGMFTTTTSALRTSRRKISTIKPVSRAPRAPSLNRLFTARVTYGDWSNSKLTRMSSGNSCCIFGKAFLISSITLIVEASARFVARMYTARRPLTSAYPVVRSVASSTVPMSRRYTAPCGPWRSGIEPKSCRFLISALVGTTG